MKRTKELLILFIFCLIAGLIFPIVGNKVYAETKNEVTLNFEGATINDGVAEYDGLGNILLLKNNDAIDITNNMKIDLNEAKYELQVIGRYLFIEDPNGAFENKTIVAIINNWYYGLVNNQGIIKLEKNELSDVLNIKLKEDNSIHINTKVENVYENITATGTIDLTKEKKYIIDFSKDDELTNGLKTFVDLEKTLYYKRVNEGLLKTDNDAEACIKITGNKDENTAVLEVLNTNNMKEEKFKGLNTQYTGSKLEYKGSTENIINEIRTDYYTKCTYDFTFQYVKEEVEPKEYKVIEGANQIYTKNESKNAAFRIDADYSLFENKVYVDNKLLDITNYDSKSGSTIITLKDEYLKTLSVGEHTLKVAFSDGGEAITKFEIKEKQQNIEENKNDEDNKNAENENNTNIKNEENINTEDNTNKIDKKQEGISNPKTGDNILVYSIVFVVSITGMVILFVINKNKIIK